MYCKPARDLAAPTVKDTPTLDDARAALLLLKDLLGEFPWVDEVDRAVGLAMLMTPILRSAMPHAPF